MTRQSERKALAAILLLTLVLGGLSLNWGLPGLDSWSNDAPVPRPPLEFGRIWLEEGHKYPYLQLGLDRVLYTPYLLWLRASGGIVADCQPLRDCFVDETRAMTVLIVISRLRSLAMLAGLVLGVFVFTQRLLGSKQAALWAALWAALTGELAFFGGLGNLDVPYLFWYVWALVALLRLVDRGQPRDYAAFGLLATLSITTKDQVFAAYALPGLAVLALHWRRVAAEAASAASTASSAAVLAGSSVATSAAPAWRRFLDRRLLLLAAALLLPFLLINNVLFNWDGFVAHVNYYIAPDGEVAALDSGLSLAGELAQFGDYVDRLAKSMGRPLLALGLVGSAAALWQRSRRMTWWLLPLCSYYLFLILPLRVIDTRFSLPSVILLCCSAGWLAAGLWRGRRQPEDGRLGGAGAAEAPGTDAPAAARLWAGRSAVVIVAAYSLLYSLNISLAMLDDTRYAAEAFIEANVPPHARVVAMDESRHLPRLETMSLSDLVIVDWKDLDHPEDGTEAIATVHSADWIVISDKTADKQTGRPAAVRDALLSGESGYLVAWEHQNTPPFNSWLPWAWVESRVSPRVWVLRRGTS
ncbi:MAG: glycosyltransferase family 39 protein [Ardenticatenia bacterium]|nr:glycosyltransferase family 39 protein [Ardenticatenia bacterium]